MERSVLFNRYECKFYIFFTNTYVYITYMYSNKNTDIEWVYSPFCTFIFNATWCKEEKKPVIYGYVSHQIWYSFQCYFQIWKFLVSPKLNGPTAPLLAYARHTTTGPTSSTYSYTVVNWANDEKEK